MDTLRVERSFRLASPPAALWPHVSNTNRLNRALGLPDLARADDPAAGSFDKLVRARVFGLPLAWRERPFDYSAGRWYRVVREFQGGPLARFEGGLRLSPDGTGTRAVLDGEFTPRWALARPAVALFARKGTDDMAALLQRIDASLCRAEDACGCLPRTKNPTDERLLLSRARRLEHAPAEAARRLVQHLKTSADDDLYHFRPFELADRWGLERTETVAACLHAVKAGLLDMSWEVLCPNCGGAPETCDTLGRLRNKSACPGCGIEYGVGFDEHVELRFTVHPSVRTVAGARFCAGSPAHTPHAMAQAAVSPGAARALDVDLGARSYRLRALGKKKAVLLRPRADGPDALTVDLSGCGEDAELSFKPGAVRLTLTSACAELARVEPETWREAGATASFVTSLQEFRDLFSSEVLAPGLEIGVKRLALLFTDLKGSTALYERVGDATAYAVVRDHFDYLTGIVKAHRGAVVKTIGDAVMAVFASGADALEAALDMQERIAELDKRLAPRPAVTLKIGVHEGPAIAINAGGVLDYFGTTANIAARVQNESEGGDVVITDALRCDPAARDVVRRRGVPSESFACSLKGLAGDRLLWRLRPGRK